MKGPNDLPWNLFWKRVGAHGRKPRILSEFEGSNGRRFAFFYGGKEAHLFSADYPHLYAISGYDLRTPLRLAPMLEHLRTTFKIDPLDSAFGWLVVCFHGAQKMIRKAKGRKKA